MLRTVNFSGAEKRAARKLWAFVLIALAPGVSLASVEANSGRVAGERFPLVEQGQRIWSAAVHDSEFAPVPNSVSPAQCGAVESPQPLATPDPLLDRADTNSRVKITFVVGTDGRVYSAFILNGADLHEDRRILNTVRSWRYRPALCNGIPTDAEGRVEFSSR
ncbi:MAG: energy transducer TonB [Terriglobales bacterium]